MDVDEFESSSDQSTDEELCQQLRDAGLKLGRKRRKQSFRESEKRSKLDFKQNLDLDKLDIMNASLFEKIGEDFMELDACTTISSNRGFAETIPIDAECSTASRSLGDHSAAMSSSQNTSTSIMTLSDVHDPSDLVNQNGGGFIELLTVDQISSDKIQPTESATISRDNFGEPKVTLSSPKFIILSDEPYYGDLVSQKQRQNKSSKDPNKYPRNLNREPRMKGEHYLGYRRDRKAMKNEKFKVKHDVIKPARSMKPACTSSFCKKSKLRACDIINEEQRKHLFTTFWKTMNWEQRRSFICSHVMAVEKKITKNPESKKTESRSYIFTIENKRYQVCKRMFLDTLGIKDWFVRYWLKKTDFAMPPDRAISSVNRNVPTKTGGHEHVEKFLAVLPKRPLPQRPTPLYSIKPINQLAKLNKAKIPITRCKYQDLQDLKSVLPQTCHSFYDELPYSG